MPCEVSLLEVIEDCHLVVVFLSALPDDGPFVQKEVVPLQLLKFELFLVLSALFHLLLMQRKALFKFIMPKSPLLCCKHVLLEEVTGVLHASKSSLSLPFLELSYLIVQIVECHGVIHDVADALLDLITKLHLNLLQLIPSTQRLSSSLPIVFIVYTFV